MAKPCTKCGKSEPEVTFRMRRRPDGKGWIRRPWCRKCESKARTEYRRQWPERQREVARRYKRTHIKKIRRGQARRCWRKIGLDVDFVEHYMEIHKKCEICGASETERRALSVDHCHKTNMFRGILCDSCNRGLGYFKDNTKLLLKAADYLGKFNENGTVKNWPDARSN